MNDKSNKSKEKQSVVIETTPRSNDKPGGNINMSEDVVATVAGLVAREIDGIHALGRSRMISFGDDPSRGVEAEVGKKEAAVDMEVVIEYGCDLRDMAAKLRERVGAEVEKMAGRKVVEVNIDVIDVHLPGSESDTKEEARRVV
jgi:uncharacterized alkaline shock family protein YloU